MTDAHDTPRLYSPTDLRVLYQQEVDAVAHIVATGQRRGPKTGLRQLDTLLGGFLPNGLYVLHGEPGSGKSALAWQIAADCGCTSLFLTTEMSPLELMRRHVSRLARRPRRSLLSGVYEADEEKAMGEYASRQDCPYILDACTAPASAAFIAQQMEDVRNLTKSPYLLVVIDSLHSWSSPLSAMAQITEYEALNAAMATLRELSTTYQAAIVILAERNRMSMRQGGMSAVAGTRRVEYGADVLMELGRDDKDRGESSGVDRIDLKITKNRLGPAGSGVSLMFRGDTMTFTEVTLQFE